jgi:hypothetical protein
MQATILDQVDDVVPKEPMVISSMRADPRIRSIVVIRSQKPTGHFSNFIDANHDEGRSFEQQMADVLRFLVSDLLGDVRYSVTERASFCEIAFPGKQEDVLVAVDRGADIVEIADSIADHLAAITTSN